MSIEQFLAAVQSRAEGRFELQTAGAEIDALQALAPEQLTNRQVIRLCRIGNERAGWRTLLIATLASTSDLTTANRWAAEARDSLPEPGTADLYLFLLTDAIVDNVGADIEASELFCRKFVLRQNESAEELLDRTFLTRLFSQTAGVSFTDPLQAALSQTAEHHLWFSVRQQEAWRGALLSGKPGSDIVDDLLAQVSDEEVPR
jgi:hypothetical protein